MLNVEGLAEIITDFFNSIGQTRPFDGVCSMSGLPPKADLGVSSRHVAQVPKD